MKKMYNRDFAEIRETDGDKWAEYVPPGKEYEDKIANLEKERQKVRDGTHPQYINEWQELKEEYNDRFLESRFGRNYYIMWTERNYVLKKQLALEEFKEKVNDVKRSLLSAMKDKRLKIEADHYMMKCSDESSEEMSSANTPLRKRNVSTSVPKKTRKRETQLNDSLDNTDIDSDLETSRPKKKKRTVRKQAIESTAHCNGESVSSQQTKSSLIQTELKNGKLFYNRNWFHCGQSIYVKGKSFSRFAATISAIGNVTDTKAIWVKKVSNGNEMRIYTSQLRRGKVSIKKRAC